MYYSGILRTSGTKLPGDYFYFHNKMRLNKNRETMEKRRDVKGRPRSTKGR